MPINGKFVSDRSRTEKEERLERIRFMAEKFDLSGGDIIYSGRRYPDKKFQELMSRRWEGLGGEKAFLIEDAVLISIGTYPEFPRLEWPENIDPYRARGPRGATAFATAA
ncbi:hypothetical protein GCM10008171_01650 [Methylopila jiangsuensis]|uniref:Uncharacterized protein n=1 Tax=Methylopila jiangsuensis TaxID=586230 RepID=A0A9W6JCT0_9HYPH|nr:hypothetical protein [Methylopila jiangsuensis]MDR6287332.1 hypothetical protein [Methylopila jiangsuensis]GLK74912.1 hypothetical protein GCM10008171_01650 [Methylopila jiangsuensis]